jgi:sugar phosphate isomerase/epimerase
VVAPYDPDLSRLSDRIAEFCDLAAPFGLTINLEFFPWTVVPNLSTAVHVIGKVDRQNSGILVDALHFDRSDSTLDQLRNVPATWLNFMHLCDAAGPRPSTNDGLIFTAREDRLPPGEGEIDLVSILNHMPPELAIGVEVPLAGSSVATYESLVRRCRDGAGRVVANARSSRQSG